MRSRENRIQSSLEKSSFIGLAAARAEHAMHERGSSDQAGRFGVQAVEHGGGGTRLGSDFGRRSRRRSKMRQRVAETVDTGSVLELGHGARGPELGPDSRHRSRGLGAEYLGEVRLGAAAAQSGVAAAGVAVTERAEARPELALALG